MGTEAAVVGHDVSLVSGANLRIEREVEQNVGADTFWRGGPNLRTYLPISKYLGKSLPS